jgi:hypothetical protein
MYRRNHMRSGGFRTSIVAYSDVGVPGCRRADLGVAGVVHRFGSSYSVFCKIYERRLARKFFTRARASLKTSCRFLLVHVLRFFSQIYKFHFQLFFRNCCACA